MALSPDSNKTLITSAETVNVNSSSSVDVESDANKATAFVIDGKNSGDHVLKHFGKNDSLLVKSGKIFDGNGDGIIDFGNGILDVDRYGAGASKAGASQYTLEGMDSNALRYLGSKDGYFAYADASVKLAGFTEGTVGNDQFNAAGGAKTYFYDNALGLNLGADTINNFGKDDFIVTTKALFNADGVKGVNFGTNGVLDISGQGGAASTDPANHPGGQLDLNGVGGVDVTNLFLDHVTTANGVTYYYYNGGDLVA